MAALGDAGPGSVMLRVPFTPEVGAENDVRPELTAFQLDQQQQQH